MIKSKPSAWVRNAMRALFGAASLAVALVVFYYAVIFTGQLPDHPLIRGFNDLVLHAGLLGC